MKSNMYICTPLLSHKSAVRQQLRLLQMLMQAVFAAVDIVSPSGKSTGMLVMSLIAVWVAWSNLRRKFNAGEYFNASNSQHRSTCLPQVAMLQTSSNTLFYA